MRDAASLVLVRDGAGGLEVLLVERGSGGDFPGLHVFPGGLVDSHDADPRLLAHSRRDAATADSLLGRAGALPAFIAALRESLEEVGILPGSAAPPPAHWQRALNARERRLPDLLAEGLPPLATDELGYFSHWITPEGIPRRYDTRFFVARAPRDQAPQPDGREAVRAGWYRPQDALAAHADGALKMIFPTIRNLQALAAWHDVDALLAHARTPRPVPAMLPRLRRAADGSVQLLLPGDAGYAEA